jgi:hypothetical protein
MRVLPLRIAYRTHLGAPGRNGPSAHDMNRMLADVCCHLALWQSLELRVRCFHVSA